MTDIKYMSNKQEKICSLASQLAYKSDMNQKHGAVIVCGNKIIGKGYNSYCNNKKCHSTHAEVAAIINAMEEHNITNFEKSILYVVRISRHNPTKTISRPKTTNTTNTTKTTKQETKTTTKQDTTKTTTKQDLRMSKPCEKCTNFIIEKKISTVYYSID